MDKIFYQLFCVALVISFCQACSNTNDCKFNEICSDGSCVLPCTTVKCGDDADCLNDLRQSLCYCKIGFTGNATSGCTKLDQDPCESNPCGPNSVCMHGVFGLASSKNFGPYCLCQENFYGRPPNCHAGCETNADCKSGEVCNETNFCVNYCNPSVCGLNSICRNGHHLPPHCSCQDGYVPEVEIGCRLRRSNDSEIPASKTPCEKYCGHKADCGIRNGNLECWNRYEHEYGLSPFVSHTGDADFKSPDACDNKALTPECAVGLSECLIRALCG